MKLLLMTLLLVPSACTHNPDTAATAQASSAPRIDGTEAKKLVASGALLLDVRSPEEFADGHIEGARNIPVNEIRTAMASLPKDKPIVVYCAAGARATVAAGELESLIHGAWARVRSLALCCLSAPRASDNSGPT